MAASYRIAENRGVSHPETIGPYRVLRELGSGGMGSVYEVQRPGDPRPLALKLITAASDEETSCVVVQTPSFYGHLIDLAPVVERAHAVGALVVAVVTEVVSLGLIDPPGARGAFQVWQRTRHTSIDGRREAPRRAWRRWRAPALHYQAKEPRAVARSGRPT